MCLIYVAHRVHPRHRLVVAANRDEFHDRAAAPAHWWADRPTVLAGRDLEGGGTWMGVSRGGRFAAVTNFRDPPSRNPAARTRGELVSNFLVGAADALDYLHEVKRDAACYNGFSLLVHDGRTLACFSNRGQDPCEVTPGVHGLSNHLLDSPWPKVEEGKRDLLGLLAADTVAPQDMLSLLDHREPADDDRLPDSGVGVQRERALSARFILGESYGTRCSTVALVSAGGEVEYRERSFDATGEARGDEVFRFSISSAELRVGTGP